MLKRKTFLSSGPTPDKKGDQINDLIKVDLYFFGIFFLPGNVVILVNKEIETSILGIETFIVQIVSEWKLLRLLNLISCEISGELLV